MAKWSESTRKKVGQVVIRILAEAGYLMLQETDKLIEAVQLVNDRLVSDKRRVVDAVEEAIALIESRQAAKCASKRYLESREDVDAYLETLKGELLAALEQNARIRIQ